MIDSTRAALDFMEYLYKRFDGDWYHAIAAYNIGEGRVLQAIARNKKQGKSTDFFSLKLPSQTKQYVPKLLAAAQLLKHQKMIFPARRQGNWQRSPQPTMPLGRPRLK